MSENETVTTMKVNDREDDRERKKSEWQWIKGSVERVSENEKMM